ncbi:tRNA methyltransferase 2 [Chytridiales sp. JEL 0842]|nr:tRNA methyltransferase 2 [Chytridiales sp. JEL 0842]
MTKREIQDIVAEEQVEVKRIKTDDAQVLQHEEVADGRMDDERTHAGEEDAPVPAEGDKPNLDETVAAKFPVKLNNLDKKATQKDIKKALDGIGLSFVKIKKVFNLTYGIVWFSSEEARKSALEKLSGLQVKKTIIHAEIHHEQSRDQNNDRRRDNRKKQEDEKPDDRTPLERIMDQTAPLWRKPYDEQLKEKTIKMRMGLGTMKTRIMGHLTNRETPPEKKIPLEWVKNLGKEKICPMEEIIPSPVQEGYRTKCEFTMGIDLDGNKCVGFLLGLYKDGVTTVLPPTDCKHVSDKAKSIAALMQEHINGYSMDVYDRQTKKGFWRLMQVRTHLTNEGSVKIIIFGKLQLLTKIKAMVIVQVNPAGFSADELEKIKTDVVNRFKAAAVGVSTILWQESEAVFNGITDKEPMNVIYGPGYVHEKLLDINFRISPSAFFQINTPATEILYTKVREWCALDQIELPQASTDAETTETAEKPGVVLLDLCCGTGTIGLTMASKVKKVIGVEMIPAAIEDAKFNAEANGIKNVVYIAAKVEDAMKEVFSKHVSPGDVVVAVLDPPRSGVGASVIQAIRACSGIDRVIYVSCDFSQAVNNFIEPIRAVPVDLFPDTPHCELLMELRRIQLKDAKETTDAVAEGESV